MGYGVVRDTQLGRAARSLTLTAERSHRRDMARAGPVRTALADGPAGPAGASAAIPGDHMANATTGLPPGVQTMTLETFEMSNGRVLKDVRCPLPPSPSCPGFAGVGSWACLSAVAATFLSVSTCCILITPLLTELAYPEVAHVDVVYEVILLGFCGARGCAGSLCTSRRSPRSTGLTSSILSQ